MQNYYSLFASYYSYNSASIVFLRCSQPHLVAKTLGFCGFFIVSNRIGDTTRWYRCASIHQHFKSQRIPQYKYTFYTISLNWSKLTVCHLLTKNRIMVPTFITCRLWDLLTYTSCPRFYKKRNQANHIITTN